MAHILIAEDETPIRRLIADNLALVGHTPLEAADGPQAVALAQAHACDLALLDIMLPGLDGFAVKQQLPPALPVIFVTARAGLSSKLQGLGLGADDYITKPFEMLELLARVQAVLRRTGAAQSAFVHGETRVELDTRRAFLRSVEITLTPQEFLLLEVLIQNRGLALSREKLLELAWGYDFEGDSRTVDVHIQKLRSKLGWEDVIQTVYKLGYRLATGGGAV